MKLFLFLLLWPLSNSIHFHSHTDYTKWDWETLLSQLTHIFKQYHLEELLPSLHMGDVNLTKTCHDDLMFLRDSVTGLLKELQSVMKGKKADISESGKHLALPMLDSSSKIGPGILRGHTHFLGFLPQCLKVKYFATELQREIQGDYYRVYLNLPWLNKSSSAQLYECSSLDLCLPHSCKNDELTPLFQSIKAGKGRNQVAKAEHINAHIPPPDVGTYIMLTVFLILIVLCVLSSIVDYCWLSQKANLTDAQRFISAFSFLRNVREVFIVRIAEEDHISVLHCMRFLSIAWVISAHTYGFLSLLVKNPLDQLDTVRHGYWTAFYANGFPAVDSFFYMSGLLLSYLWFKEFRKNSMKTMSLRSWLFFYIHRFFRLSPAYYLTLLFYTFIFSRLYTDMPLLTLSEIQNDTCREQWWINILYLNNFISQEKMCFVVSWYLAVDIQLFLFSPLLLLPFAFFGFTGGLIVAALFIIASISLTVYQVYIWNFPPLLYRLSDRNEQTTGDYQFWMYYQPFVRCQPYIVGIIVGYFLQFTKRFTVHKMLNCLMYALSSGILFIVVFGVNSFLNGVPMSTLESALYNGCAKLGWSLALAWITISCYYNHGGAVQSFMSWWIWIPLGRLSFCAYLIHIPLILFVWGMDKSEKIYSGELDTFVNSILPAIFYSFGMAIVWKALVETPFTKIEFILVQRWNGGQSLSGEKSSAKLKAHKTTGIISIINQDITQL